MSITSANIGDIIAMGRVAWEIAQALTGRGSVKEYQGLIEELEAFDKALLQVAALWQNREPCPELETLSLTTRDAVKDLRDTLLAFRLKVDKKYGTSFCVAGSGQWLKDSSKKVLWLEEKKDILELRSRLHSASDTLSLLILTVTEKSNRLASSAHAQQVELLYRSLQESTKYVSDQMAQLRLMDESLDAQAATSNMILSVMNRGHQTAPLEDINTGLPTAISLKDSLESLNEPESAIRDTDKLPTSRAEMWLQSVNEPESAIRDTDRLPTSRAEMWLQSVNEPESAIQDTDRLPTSRADNSSDDHNISLNPGSPKHEHPQNATRKKGTFVLLAPIPWKGDSDSGKASRIQDISSSSTSSHGDDLNHGEIPLERGYTEDDRAKSIPLLNLLNTILSNFMSSEDKLNTKQESMDQSSDMMLNSSREKDLYNPHVTPNPGRRKHEDWRRKVAHPHGSYGNHSRQSIKHRIVSPEYRWEYFWGCCYCRQHDSMSTFIEQCPGCCHSRCGYCVMESTKIRVHN